MGATSLLDKTTGFTIRLSFSKEMLDLYFSLELIEPKLILLLLKFIIL